MTVVFGGYAYPKPNGSVTATAETWTFDGSCWQQLHPATSPSARGAQGMVFDPAIGKTLLVGGDSGGCGYCSGRFPADAWLWDGVNWSRVAGAPGFVRVEAAFDEARNVVVVYGSGAGDFGTWTWDGTTWLKQSPANSPSPRDSAEICYDQKAKTTLLFGGHANFDLGDTWEWNGFDWVQDHPSLSPSPRFGAALLCGGDRVILAGGTRILGGLSTPPLNDVWTWDGRNWSQLISAPLPDGLMEAGAVFDGSRFLLLLGAQATMPARAEVWSYQSPGGWTTVVAS